MSPRRRTQSGWNGGRENKSSLRHPASAIGRYHHASVAKTKNENGHLQSGFHNPDFSSTSSVRLRLTEFEFEDEDDLAVTWDVSANEYAGWGFSYNRGRSVKRILIWRFLMVDLGMGTRNEGADRLLYPWIENSHLWFLNGDFLVDYYVLSV